MKYIATVTFDPENLEHRRDFFRSLECKTLSKCMNRYNLEGNYGDVLSMMTDQVVRYYAANEFQREKNEDCVG